MPLAQERLTNNVNVIRAAGIFILLLSAAAALLPLLGPVAGTVTIGTVLLAAGFAEMLAGMARHEARSLAILAGTSTVAAGFLFFLNFAGDLLSSMSVIAVWLFARAIILFFTLRVAHGKVRMWIGISALTDLALGLALVAGLSVTSLAVMVFGPLPAVVASFAWVLALSFVATGTFLLEVAGCESPQPA
jgi:uncharacterized membrane protein HdeD (DUF308 family)